MIIRLYQRRLGEGCGRGSIIVVDSGWVSFPSSELWMVKLVLGDEILILGIIILGMV